MNKHSTQHSKELSLQEVTNNTRGMGCLLPIPTPASIQCVFLNIRYFSGILCTFLSSRWATPHFTLLCNPSENTLPPATRKPPSYWPRCQLRSITITAAFLSDSSKAALEGSVPEIMPCGLLLSLSSINSLARILPKFPTRSSLFIWVSWQVILLEISLNYNL